TAKLLATTKTLRRTDDQHERQGRQRTYAGMGHEPPHFRSFLCFLRDGCAELVDGWFSRSSNSSRSCRCRLLQGARENDSNCTRPDLLHSAFLRRIPSFIATACN